MNECKGKTQSLFGVSGIYCENGGGIISKGRHGNNAIGEKDLPSSKLAMNDKGRSRIGTKNVRKADEFK